MLLTFAEVQSRKKLIWLAGWFPTSNNPLAGNFILRHAQAVAGQLSENPHYSPVLTLFHFPVFNAGESAPVPAGIAWKEAGDNTEFSNRFGNTTVYDGDVDSTPMLLYWSPVKQFSNFYLKWLNALIYWLQVTWVLLDFSRQQTNEELLYHVHAGDKIGWPLGFVKKYLWKNCPLWYTEHWAIFGNPVADEISNRSAFFRWYMKRLWKQSDVSAAISVYTHQQMQHTYHVAKRMVLFRNPVDVTKFVYSDMGGPKLGLVKDSPENDAVSIQNTLNWLHVSNFDTRKQIPLIIKVFRALQDEFQDVRMELKLVGGTKEGLLMKNPDISESDIQESNGIKVLGSMDASLLAETMRASSALLLFSSAENAPCVIAEAQCCGLPVICNPMAGIPEMVIPENVWFTAGNAYTDLLDRMRAFVRVHSLGVEATDTSSIQFAENRKKSAQLATERFSPNAIGSQILSAYLRYTP